MGDRFHTFYKGGGHQVVVRRKKRREKKEETTLLPLMRRGNPGPHGQVLPVKPSDSLRKKKKRGGEKKNLLQSGAGKRKKVGVRNIFLELAEPMKKVKTAL